MTSKMTNSSLRGEWLKFWSTTNKVICQDLPVKRDSSRPSKIKPQKKRQGDVDLESMDWRPRPPETELRRLYSKKCSATKFSNKNVRRSPQCVCRPLKCRNVKWYTQIKHRVHSCTLVHHRVILPTDCPPSTACGHTLVSPTVCTP